jgi:hypothetical protein
MIFLFSVGLLLVPIARAQVNATPASTENSGLYHLVRNGFHGTGSHIRSQITAAQARSESRVDIFGAYSRWYPTGQVQGYSFKDVGKGTEGSATYYFDNNIGVEAEGDYHPQNSVNGITGFAGGPVYRFQFPGIAPSIHALVGGARLVGPIVPSNGSNSYFANPPKWGTSATLGFSADYILPHTNRHVGIRFQADYQYFHCSYGYVQTAQGGQVNISSYRINPGILVRFGHTGPAKKRR